jgi:exopolysaccharide biosynthesis polyprenyl glycosylphosphotransferase
MRLQNIHVPLLTIALFLLDIIVIFGVAMLVTSPIFHLGSLAIVPVFGIKVAAIVASAVFAAFTMGLYQREFFGRAKLPSRLAIAFVLSVIVTAGLSQIGSATGVAWLGILLVNVPAFVLMLFNRLICCSIAEHMKARILYFGPPGGLSSLRKVERVRRPTAFSIAGEFIVDQRQSEAELSALLERAQLMGVNEIVIGGSEETLSWFAKAILSRPHVNVTVLPLSAFIERETRKIDIHDPEAARQLAFYRSGRTKASDVLKRVMDVCFAVAFLALTLPVTAIVTALILLLEGRPVFYHQERVGLGGSVFTLYKFRSMTVNAEADGVARWAALDDNRVTGIGRILRLTRIDEIPQLINVLRGDMTLVGPRPERPSIVAALQERIPLYESRHSVPPGVTGWAQISYPYGASVEDAEVKTCYDLYYVKNASLLLDVVILLQTVRVILLGEGSR